MNHSSSLHQPSVMIFLIIVIVGVYVGSAAAARSESEHDHVCFSAAETRDKILTQELFEPFHAMRSEAGRLQAEAIGVKLCRLSEELVYELSLLRRDGHVVHVLIDAKTGRAIGSANKY